MVLINYEFIHFSQIVYETNVPLLRWSWDLQVSSYIVLKEKVHRNNLNLAKYLTILKSNFIFLLDNVMAFKLYRNFRTQIQRWKFIKDLRYVFTYFLCTFIWRIPVTHTSNMFKVQHNGSITKQSKPFEQRTMISFQPNCYIPSKHVAKLVNSYTFYLKILDWPNFLCQYLLRLTNLPYQ